MKKFWVIGLLISCLCFGALVSADEGKSVDVMFMHDMHSHLNEFTTVENGETMVLGGLAKIKTLIDDKKAENPDTLLLDAGDFSMGTFVQVVYEAEASELRMLGELGIDATTFGNHEFDYGAQGIANMLDSAVKSSDKLPEILVCNVDWEGMETAGLTEDQKVLKDAFEKYGVKNYTVIEKGDVKIAVFGVLGEDSEDCIADCPIEFGSPVEFAKKTVAEIKANEKVDMIVCVSHGGTWEKTEDSEDEILAQEVPEIDLIISGHTHTKIDEPIVHGNTYIVSAMEYGKYLGSLSLTQNAEGRWNMENYELVLVDESIEEDPETQAKVDYFMGMVDEVYLKQFGYTKDQVLAHNEVQFTDQSMVATSIEEVNLGCIMADAYAYAVETLDDVDTNPVDFAVAPAGTIRDTYPLGNITVENVFHSFSLGIGQDKIPGYPLISVYLTGEELKLAAELDASIAPLMSSARLHSSGLCWKFNPNRLILNKVTDTWLEDDGERVEIEDEKLYRVVTDMYSAKMLGGVTDLSYGLLKLVPKDKDGNPIEDYNAAIVTSEGKEVKGWYAIAQYMESFEDTDGDGVSDVPEVYGTNQGRKVVEDSKNILKLINHPNKFAFLIIGALCIVILILVIIILTIWNLIKKVVRFIKRK